MLLVQSIHITDNFGFDKQSANKQDLASQTETVFLATDSQPYCVNGMGKFPLKKFSSFSPKTKSRSPQNLGLVAAGAIFLLAQLAVIAIWSYLWQRRRKTDPFQATMLSGTVPGPQIPSGGPSNSRTESMCKLYDTGYAGRHF